MEHKSTVHDPNLRSAIDSLAIREGDRLGRWH